MSTRRQKKGYPAPKKREVGDVPPSLFAPDKSYPRRKREAHERREREALRARGIIPKEGG